MDNFPSIRKPNYGDYGEKTTAITRTTEFEDGLSKVRPKWHYATRTISLSWSELKQTDFDALVAFFEDHAGEKFNYTTPDGSETLVCYFLDDRLDFKAVRPSPDGCFWSGEVKLVAVSGGSAVPVMGRLGAFIVNGSGEVISEGMSISADALSSGQTAYVCSSGSAALGNVSSGASVIAKEGAFGISAYLQNGAAYEGITLSGVSVSAGAKVNGMTATGSGNIVSAPYIVSSGTASVFGTASNVGVSSGATLVVCSGATAYAGGSGTMVVKSGGSGYCSARYANVYGYAEISGNTLASVFQDGTAVAERADNISIYSGGLVQSSANAVVWVYDGGCVSSCVLSSVCHVNGGGRLADVTAGRILAENSAVLNNVTLSSGAYYDFLSGSILNSIKFRSGAIVNGIDIVADTSDYASGYVAISGIARQSGEVFSEIYKGQKISAVSVSSGANVNGFIALAPYSMTDGVNIGSAVFGSEFDGFLYEGQSVEYIRITGSQLLFLDGGAVNSAVLSGTSARIVGSGNVNYAAVASGQGIISGNVNFGSVCVSSGATASISNANISSALLLSGANLGNYGQVDRADIASGAQLINHNICGNVTISSGGYLLCDYNGTFQSALVKSGASIDYANGVGCGAIAFENGAVIGSGIVKSGSATFPSANDIAGFVISSQNNASVFCNAAVRNVAIGKYAVLTGYCSAIEFHVSNGYQIVSEYASSVISANYFNLFIQDYARVDVSSGFFLTSATVDSHANFNDYGTASNLVVRNTASATVYSGALLDTATISSGATLRVKAGGTATNITSMNGAIVIYEE